MKSFNIKFSIVISIIWILPHIVGWWNFDIISVLFPLLWLIVQSHNLDKEEQRNLNPKRNGGKK